MDDCVFYQIIQGVLPAHKILLRPNLEVTLKRNASRTNKDFNTAILEPVIRDLRANMKRKEFQNAGWAVLDSSDMNLKTTVRLILEKWTSENTCA